MKLPKDETQACLYCIDREWVYFTGRRVFNWVKEEHRPSCVRLEEEKKQEECCGRWGTLAIVRETAE